MTRCKAKIMPKSSKEKIRLCKNNAAINSLYCHSHQSYVDKTAVQKTAVQEKSYTNENESRIRAVQTIYKAQKRKKNAIKTIAKFRSLQSKQKQIQDLLTARRMYKRTHKNIGVSQPTIKLDQQTVTKPNLYVTESKFRPNEKIASFMNKNGKIMNPPIPFSQNVQYFTKHNLHPVDWQKFGNRPTRPRIQSYRDHMLHSSLQFLKTKPSPQLKKSIYNNEAARTYIKNLFTESVYSKKEIKSKIYDLRNTLKVNEEANMYFKYPAHIQPQYNTKGINSKLIFKVNEPLQQIHAIQKRPVVLTRIKIKKTYTNFIYTLYYGKGERGHFEYSGIQIFY